MAEIREVLERVARVQKRGTMQPEARRRRRRFDPGLRGWLIASLGLTLAACGGKVVVDASPSGSSVGGAGGGSAGGVGGAASTTTSTTSTSTAGPGGVGGGVVMPSACGEESGIGCPADQFCDYVDDGCGKGKINGVCTPRPQNCPPSFQPTCGCDMLVHNTPCDSQHEGADLSTVEWCVPPPGTFQCGAFFCTVGKEYCEHLVVNQGDSETASCQPLPPCGASCDCLLNVTCGSACGGTPEGGVEIYCPVGG